MEIYGKEKKDKMNVLMLSTVEELRKVNSSYHFSLPFVDVYPDKKFEYKRFSNQIDLNVIKSKCEGKLYSSMEQFLRDFHYMYSNFSKIFGLKGEPKKILSSFKRTVTTKVQGNRDLFNLIGESPVNYVKTLMQKFQKEDKDNNNQCASPSSPSVKSEKVSPKIMTQDKGKKEKEEDEFQEINCLSCNFDNYSPSLYQTTPKKSDKKQYDPTKKCYFDQSKGSAIISNANIYNNKEGKITPVINSKNSSVKKLIINKNSEKNDEEKILINPVKYENNNTKQSTNMNLNMNMNMNFCSNDSKENTFLQNKRKRSLDQLDEGENINDSKIPKIIEPKLEMQTGNISIKVKEEDKNKDKAQQKENSADETNKETEFGDSNKTMDKKIVEFDFNDKGSDEKDGKIEIVAVFDAKKQKKTCVYYPANRNTGMNVNVFFFDDDKIC